MKSLSGFSKSTIFHDEEKGMYVGVPLEENEDKDHKATMIVKEGSSHHQSWACYLISSIQVGALLILILKYGIAPYKSNPYIGPPMKVIDEWGSKNPYRIVTNGEYWRVFTALFLNVGLIDLIFSVAILFCLGYHLEKRWGNLKLCTVYLTSGICGNIFSTFSTPDAISIGSGGCIFGVLGMMHVEMVHSIIDLHFLEAQNEDDNEKFLIEDEENDKKEDEEEDLYIYHSAFIVLGFLGGLVFTFFTSCISSQTPRLAKDWSVLYGGMISGMILGLIWYLCSSFPWTTSPECVLSKRRLKVFSILVLIIVPFMMEAFLSLQVSRISIL